MRIEARIDWLTCTLKSDAEDATALGLRAAADAAMRAQGPDVIPRMQKRLGYYGTSGGQVFYGARPDGWMVVASGATASDLAERLATLPIKTTRIDLQVTLWYKWDHQKRARFLADHLEALRTDGKQRVDRVHTLYDGYARGSTLYVGSRASDQVGRCYDKGRQSLDENYLKAWRYEVEYKGERAQVVFDAYQSAASKVDFVVGQVAEWFKQRGVSDVSRFHTGAAVPCVIPRRTEDAARLLTWLATAVKPAVGRLCDVGLRAEVLDALGLRNGE